MATSIRTDGAAVAAAIATYLNAGKSDPLMAAWSGDLREKAAASRRDLRGALIEEVSRRAAGRSHPPLPAHDSFELTRRRVLPMITGLFPVAEREAILSLVERSVIFVTEANIRQVLMNQRWDHTAWALANLHLGTLRAPLLGSGVQAIVGLSEETTCYVSPLYFSDPDPLSDFLVHEVAHTFHNSKRIMAGLVETRHREWLLDIAFRKRETFAYACEYYPFILEHSANARHRRSLATGLVRDKSLGDARVAPAEVADIVSEAARSRAGWKLVLRRCG